MKRSLTLIVLMALIGFGCASEDPNKPNEPPPTLRLLHMVYDGQPLDLRGNGQVVADGATYGSSTGYKQTVAGQVDVSVHYAGDANPRNSSKQTLTNGLAHSVYAFPPAASFAAGFQADPIETSPDKSRLKLVHASYDNDTFELRITGSRTVLLGPLRRIQVAQYVDLFAGSYRFSLKKPKDTTWSMEFEAVNLSPQSAYTIVIHGTLTESDAYPFGLRMFTDNGAGTDYIDLVKAPATAKLLYVNSVVGSTPIDVAVDGSTPQIKQLAFGQPSHYMTLAAGAHMYSAGTGTTTIVSNQTTNLTASKAYSIFLTGTLVPPNFAPLQLEDETLPSETASMLRFVHLVPDAPAVNVLVKDLMGPGQDYKIPGIDAVVFRQTSVSTANPGSAFLSFPASPTTYTLKFVDAASNAVLLETANLKFEAGKIYTLWIGGSTAAKNVKSYMFKHN